MLDGPVSERAKIEAAEQRFALAERNRSKGEVNFIDVAGLNILPHGLDTAADLDVPCACRLARLLQRLCDAAGDKMKCRAALHLDRRPWIMGQHERRRMIGRIVAPPAFPLMVRPIPADRSEHVAAEDEGAETLHRAPGKTVIDAGFTVGFSQHLTKTPCREKPVKHLLAMHTKRMLQTLAGSRGKTVKRDTEPGDFYFRHRLLQLRHRRFVHGSPDEPTGRANARPDGDIRDSSR